LTPAVRRRQLDRREIRVRDELWVQRAAGVRVARFRVSAKEPRRRDRNRDVPADFLVVLDEIEAAEDDDERQEEGQDVNETLCADRGLELSLFKPVTMRLLSVGESENMLATVGNSLLIGRDEIWRWYRALIRLGGEDDMARPRSCVS
jgi:hypothetical protein